MWIVFISRENCVIVYIFLCACRPQEMNPNRLSPTKRHLLLRLHSMSTKNLTKHKYRQDIDGLRAIAVLSVVGFHAFPESDIFRSGFIGVDIFFVISGFLISSMIYEKLEENSFSF